MEGCQESTFKAVEAKCRDVYVTPLEPNSPKLSEEGKRSVGALAFKSKLDGESEGSAY
jgi:hypothetical protein